MTWYKSSTVAYLPGQYFLDHFEYNTDSEFKTIIITYWKPKS